MFSHLQWIDDFPPSAAESLAYEQQLLELGKPCYSLRINSPCVSVGFNQDIKSEVDTDLASSLGIPIVRRKTGGGAVFRDEGCIAYSFIVPSCCKEAVVDVIQASLARLGVRTTRSGRNDLFWEGRKVSGFACSELRGMMLLHGTILYSTDLGLMDRLLSCGKHKYDGTAIQSVRARVANIGKEFPGVSAFDFMSQLKKQLDEQLHAFGAESLEPTLDCK